MNITITITVDQNVFTLVRQLINQHFDITLTRVSCVDFIEKNWPSLRTDAFAEDILHEFCGNFGMNYPGYLKMGNSADWSEFNDAIPEMRAFILENYLREE